MSNTTAFNNLRTDAQARNWEAHFARVGLHSSIFIDITSVPPREWLKRDEKLEKKIIAEQGGILELHGHPATTARDAKKTLNALGRYQLGSGAPKGNRNGSAENRSAAARRRSAAKASAASAKARAAKAVAVARKIKAGMKKDVG